MGCDGAFGVFAHGIIRPTFRRTFIVDTPSNVAHGWEVFGAEAHDSSHLVVVVASPVPSIDLGKVAPVGVA